MTVFGSGKPLRQFIYSNDLAKLIMSGINDLYHCSAIQFIQMDNEQLQ